MFFAALQRMLRDEERSGARQKRRRSARHRQAPPRPGGQWVRGSAGCMKTVQSIYPSAGFQVEEDGEVRHAASTHRLVARKRCGQAGDSRTTLYKPRLLALPTLLGCRGLLTLVRCLARLSALHTRPLCRSSPSAMVGHRAPLPTPGQGQQPSRRAPQVIGVRPPRSSPALPSSHR